MGERAFEVIVVLGASLPPDGRLGRALEPRVVGGVEAFHRGRAPVVLMSGRYEARAMRDYAIARGVPSAAIWLEETALTTRGNALGAAELMRAHGLSRALLVTQPYHMRRSLAAFRRVGLTVAPVPIPENAPYQQRVREWVALALYAARGWLQD